MIAPATPSVAAMTTGATTLGSTCCSTMRVSRAPSALRGLHELELAHDEHLAADQPRHPRPADDADRDEHDGERRLQRGDHAR